MSVLQTLRSVIFGAKKKSPKILQERKDTSLAIFCSILRRLRLEEANQLGVEESVYDLDDQAFHHQKYVDKAVFILENRLHDESSIKDVRTELQHEFEPQVIHLFQKFMTADEDLYDRSYIQSAFDNELHNCRTIMDCDNSDLCMFTERKHKALKDVDLTNDNFRMRNVAYGTSLRKILGYNVVTFESTLESDSGSGLFVDGKAPLGSIISFIPGYVWLQEHMRSSKSLEHFLDDPNFQLTARPDGMIIDARPFDTLESKIPYFLPSGKGENPWAHGHLINHPSKDKSPNCISIMINYSNNIDTDFRSLIPNYFGKDPSFVGKGAIDFNYSVSVLEILFFYLSLTIFGI